MVLSSTSEELNIVKSSQSTSLSDKGERRRFPSVGIPLADIQESSPLQQDCSTRYLFLRARVSTHFAMWIRYTFHLKILSSFYFKFYCLSALSPCGLSLSCISIILTSCMCDLKQTIPSLYSSSWHLLLISQYYHTMSSISSSDMYSSSSR